MRRATLGLALAGAVVAGAPASAEIEITPVTSPGGISAWLVEDRTIPILSIEASFQGGALLDPPGNEGAAQLMASLLDKGAAGRDDTAFAEAREAIAARFGFGATSESVTVSAAMLSSVRGEAVGLLRDALTAPRFDAEPFERTKARALLALRADETDPSAIAGRAFFGGMFAGHPYARPRRGTVGSVEELTASDMRLVHGEALTRTGLSISVVGDITAGELGPLLDRLFGDLPVGEVPEPGQAEVNDDGSLRIIDVDAPQSVVLFGQEGLARDDPDFIPAFVMNHILGGGGFGSRMTEELREKRGLTYGVYTGLMANRHGWLITGRFSTENARAAEAIAVVRDEWRRMAERGVTQAELDAAKRYLTGAYPLRFDGNGRIAGQLLGLQTSGLGREYVEVRNDLVEAVTLDDIARVARRLLDPEALTFVVAGRPEGLEPVN